MVQLKPPFRAKNYPELFAKIQKGVYKEIPNDYSAHLKAIIHKMLQVDPKNRPTTQQLLKLDIPMLKSSSDSPTKTVYLDPFAPDQRNQLLKTIKLPRNLDFLKAILPKSNYNKDVAPTLKKHFPNS